MDWDLPDGAFLELRPDINDLFEPTTLPNPAAPPPRRCKRHAWMVEQQTGHTYCHLCGKHRDEVVRSRNRRNRQRGGAFELKVAKDYGGRKTGPLGGRDDVIVGQVFAMQTKRAQRLSLNEARTYLKDLARIYPDRIPVVVHALPGERDGIVIWRYSDHIAEHGRDGTEEAT